MNGYSPKQLALDAINDLPKDATLEDVLQRIQVIVAVQRAKAEIAASGTVDIRHFRGRPDQR